METEQLQNHYRPRGRWDKLSGPWAAVGRRGFPVTPTLRRVLLPIHSCSDTCSTRQRPAPPRWLGDRTQARCRRILPLTFYTFSTRFAHLYCDTPQLTPLFCACEAHGRRKAFSLSAQQQAKRCFGSVDRAFLRGNEYA